jgi:hypothetical protein
VYWPYWVCHNNWISYHEPRIIRVQLSDDPYPSTYANITSYSASAHNRIQIIHILMDIKKTLSHIRKKIGFGSDRMRKLSTALSPLTVFEPIDLAIVMNNVE